MMAAAWTVGVDFGGTNIKLGIVSSQRRVLADLVLPTRRHATPATFVNGVAAAIDVLRQRHGLSRRRLRGVGVGAPGLIDGDRGIIHRLVNVPGGWRGVRLQRVLERRLRCPCAIENDANVVALGEFHAGAGRGARHSVYVTLGTGVGGGFMIDGRLVRGAAGSAGEIGHMVIDPDGPRCACGARGCVEAFVGTAALVRATRAAIRAGDGRLRSLVRQAGGRITPALLGDAARAGDRAARRIWAQAGGYLGIGLANLVNVLSPERIIIGGGVAKAWPWFAPRMRAVMRAQAFAPPMRACRVVPARLGDRAGIVGAAMLIWERTTARVR